MHTSIHADAHAGLEPSTKAAAQTSPARLSTRANCMYALQTAHTNTHWPVWVALHPCPAHIAGQGVSQGLGVLEGRAVLFLGEARLPVLHPPALLPLSSAAPCALEPLEQDVSCCCGPYSVRTCVFSSLTRKSIGFNFINGIRERERDKSVCFVHEGLHRFVVVTHACQCFEAHLGWVRGKQ